MSQPTPTKSFIFNDPNNLWNDPTLTFANGSTGTAVDSNSGATAPGNLTWNPSDGLSTPSGYGMSLDPFSFGGSFSIEVVFKFTELGFDQSIFGFGHHNPESDIIMYRQGDENKISARILDGELVAGVGMVYVNMDNSDNVFDPTATNFVHVVWTQDDLYGSSGSKIYVNGNEKAVTIVTHGTNYGGLPVETRSAHWVGKISHHDTGSETTKYLKYYNSSLTQSQVTTLYQDYINGDLPSVTATGAPLKIIPNINLIKLN